ncbi:MAG: hypothetical protein QM379_06360 [Acidobacteriota bacterium]|nr:hypothetical protein [Acidobacteriota bacterium]
MAPGAPPHAWRCLPVAVGVAAAAAAGTWFWLHPLNHSSWDRTWGAATLCSLTFLGLAAWLRRGRPALAITALCTVLGASAGLVLAGAASAALAALWVVALAWGLGDLALSRLVPSSDTGRVTRSVLAVELGLGAISLATLGIGLAGWLVPAVVWPLLLAATAVVAGHALRIGGLRRLGHAFGWLAEWWRDRASPRHALAAGVLLVCLAGAFAWALAPSVWYDELNYQAAAPAQFAREGRVVDIPEEFRTVWTHNAAMLFALGAVLAGVPAIKLVSFAIGLVALAATAALGTLVGGRRVGALAAVLAAALPVWSWEMGVALVDLAVTGFVTMAAVAVVASGESQPVRWAAVGGLLAGFALGTKLNAAPFVLVLGLALLALVGLRHGPRQAAVAGASFAAAALAVLLPWLIRDWAWTGNPVFPFLNGVFQSPRWEGGASFNFETYGARSGVAALFLLPYDLLVRGDAFGPGLGPGVAGALPWLALPWLAPAMQGRRRAASWALSVGGLTAVALAMVVAQYLRYLLPALPPLAVVAALNLDAAHTLLAARWRRGAAVLATVLGLAYVGGSRLAHTAMMWEIPERFPVGVAAGHERPEALLSRAVREVDAFRFLDSRAPAGAKVLTIGCPLRLYTHTRVFEVLHEPFELRDLARSDLTGGPLAAALVQRGFTWLVIDHQNSADARPFPSALQAPDLLDRHATIEFRRNDTAVYRLSVVPVAPSRSPNLLTNPGFESTGPGGATTGWAAYGSPRVASSGGGHDSAVAVQATRDSGLTQAVPVHPEALYTLGHWTRAASSGQAARLQVNWLDSTGQIIAPSIEVVAAGPEWTWHTLTSSAPGGAAWAMVYASVHENGEVWFDDMCFVEGSDPASCHPTGSDLSRSSAAPSGFWK